MESDSSALRLSLLRKVLDLPDGRLVELEHWLAGEMAEEQQPKCQSGVGAPVWVTPHSKFAPHSKVESLRSKMVPRVWPRAPVHHLSERGTDFVTTGTLHKQHLFADAER